MSILYSEPLSRGWNRMKKALFQPFDLAKWFTVGFTAFLASLIDGHGGGGGNYSNKYRGHKIDWDEVANYPTIAWEWLMTHSLWFGLIITGLFFLIALIIVFTWLSSRGKFMFLHNVLHDKAEVSKPWNEFKEQGNSLFIWRLVYGFICFILIVLSLGVSAFIIVNLFTDYATIPTKVFSIMGLAMQFFALVVIMSYISLFLSSFIVPIMYKYKITTSKAWVKFLPILSRHIFHFILYGLFIFVLGILVVIAVVFFGLFTCCLGFLLLVIPYIGSVVFLPVSYTFRAFSIEFLEQFGEDFTFFPTVEVSENDNVQSAN